MAVIQSGATTDLATVDATTKAIRVVQRPLVPSNTTGAYRQGLFTGSMAAGLAANSEVMQFRYTGANLAIVRRVIFEGVAASTAFAAGAFSFRALLATSWTVDGSAGQVAAATSNGQELDTSYAAPVATLRVSTTVTLGAGTKTLQGVTANAQGIGLALGFTAPATPAVGQQMPRSDLLGEDPGAEHPQVLRQNEGIVVVATVPATGVWITGFTVQWIECTAAEWRV